MPDMLSWDLSTLPIESETPSEGGTPSWRIHWSSGAQTSGPRRRGPRWRRRGAGCLTIPSGLNCSKYFFWIDSENKTFQIANLSQQINTTSNDLLNLHLKIGNITISLNSLEDIKQHLIDESQRMISKSENISKENESTRLLLRNISEIYFTKLSNQSGSENKEISEAIGRVLGSVQLLGHSIGQS